ncbi:patatin-like phospholipase family protein [Aquihabitans sp. McL0605]|uniref:patatin-like phospholipase family protein n=1 Tax=Aquihabitans sp. McL0605 TaxID=3415671 RepID=UPI003CECFC3A
MTDDTHPHDEPGAESRRKGWRRLGRSTDPTDPAEPTEPTEPTEPAGSDDGPPPEPSPPADPDRADADEEVEDDRPTPRELAIERAERFLDGPALRVPDGAPSPGDLEATWDDHALDALEVLRADLGGRRVGIAISGGGSLGSFEAGVLRFLYDHAAVAPVAVAGNSAGGLNAAKLAEGDRPGGLRAVDEVDRLWRSLRTTDDMWEPEPWLTRLQASASWATSMRGHLGDGTSGTNAVRMAVRVVGGLVRRPPETDGAFDAVREALTAQSLLSLAPVSDLLQRELDADLVAASGISLRVGAVSLEAGELRYITETGAIHDRDDRPTDLDDVPLMAGVLASASIPLAFPPVRLGEEHYVDGGAREILPIEVLVHHLEVERVIAISASSVGVERMGSFAERNLIDILRRVSAEIGPDETLRKELNPPGGWAETVRVIVPEFDVHDSMTIDPALIAISIDHGWLRGADVLLELPHEAQQLTRELTEVRIGLRRLDGALTTLFGGDAAGRSSPVLLTEGGAKRPDELAPIPVELDEDDAPHASFGLTDLDGDEPEEAIDPAVETERERLVLTARLRRLVQARQDLGAPLPPSLVAWLDAPHAARVDPLPVPDRRDATDQS